jgi:hypothetical protein
MKLMNKQALTFLITYCLFGLSTIGLFAQNELGTHLGIVAKTKISKTWKAKVEVQQRFDTRYTTFDRLFIEPAINYNFHKKWRLEAIYRISYKEVEVSTQRMEHRGSMHLRFKNSIEDVTYKLKTGWQYGMENRDGYGFDYRNKLINRNSISLDYDIFGTKMTPEIEGEIFYYANHPNSGIINQWRIMAKVNYTFSNNNAIEAYYLFKQKINIAYPYKMHVFGLVYVFEL